MELSNAEQIRWNEFSIKNRRAKLYPDRDAQVIKLSNDGMSIKEIQGEIGSNYGYITEVRRKARREGKL